MNALGYAFLWFSIVCAILAWLTGEWEIKRTNEALQDLSDENGTAGAGGANFIGHFESEFNNSGERDHA